MHISRISEELNFMVILWIPICKNEWWICNNKFNMPQKKNPDVPELLRGKQEEFMEIYFTLTVMKGLPLAYNKDTKKIKREFWFS